MLRVACTLCALTLISGNANAQGGVSQSGLNDITIISVDIGHFQFGNRVIHVFENSRNKLQNADNLKAWQFNIEPLLTTIPSKDACVEFQAIPLEPIKKKEGRQVVTIQRHRIVVPLALMVDHAHTKAIEVIKSIYPKADGQVLAANIDALPITKIDFLIPDIENKTGPFNEAVTLVNKTHYFLSTPKRTHLMFDINESPNAFGISNIDRFLDFFPFLDIRANVTFNVKGATYNLAGITREDIKNTELMSKLNGYGSLVYVTRDDMRKLSEQSVSQLRTTFILEDPTTIVTTLIAKMTEASVNASIDLTKFDETVRKKTYNAKDLDPNVINRFFSSEFERVNNKWSRKSSGSSSAGGDFLGILKASGSNSYSNEQFAEFLREHGLTVEIQGNNIIPKSVQVSELSTGKFSQLLDYGFEVRQLSTTGVKSDLAVTINGSPVAEDGSIADVNCGGPRK